MQGKVYLIPNIIDDSVSVDSVLPNRIFETINNINYFIVEDIRTARRFLKRINQEIVIDNLTFFTLNKHSDTSKISEYLMPAFQGKDIGVISEAGTPCVADPGNIVVETAHNFNVDVVPLVGPSSILLAMMASGLNGQNFAFNGYLPIENSAKTSMIKNLENRSLKENQSQIFMETPYRNNKMLDHLLKVCKNSTMLCLAVNLTGTKEFIKTMSIAEWKVNKPELNKKPCIFIIHAKQI